MATTNTSARIEKAKQACRDNTTIRSDGKPWTPRGLTEELIEALLEHAGPRGMSGNEIKQEYPHRRIRSGRTLTRMEADQRIVKRDGRYFLAKASRKSQTNSDYSQPKKVPRLRATDADKANSNTNYIPQSGDGRQLVHRQIRERRGQQLFRDDLRKRYGDRCMVTGCKVLAVLEAAHIQPYRGKNYNHPGNGLLLRTDIHTLFDLDLLGIEPNRLRLELHPDLAKDMEYAILAGKPLICTRDKRPSREALDLRYQQFQQHRDGPE